MGKPGAGNPWGEFTMCRIETVGCRYRKHHFARQAPQIIKGHWLQRAQNDMELQVQPTTSFPGQVRPRHYNFLAVDLDFSSMVNKSLLKYNNM